MINGIRIHAASILSETFGTPIAPEDNPSRPEVPNWDSLKHLELVLLLEEEFDIRFTADQVACLQNFDDIVRIIGENKQ